MSRLYWWIFLFFLALGAVIFGSLAWRDTQRASIRIVWATASEIDTAGFNILRSNNPDSGFVRVNAELIPASQEPLIGGEYLYVDSEVLPGHIYYYMLENVEMNGRVTRNSPIMVKAQSNFWLYISLALSFTSLFILVLLNKNWLFTNSLHKSGKES